MKNAPSVVIALLLGALFIGAVRPATAQRAASGHVPGGVESSLGVDWKVVGGADVGQDANILFYDARGVHRLPNGHIEVWTKALSNKALENIEATKEQIDTAARKILSGYDPPVHQLRKLNDDQKLSLVIYEVFANDDIVESNARLLFELDCKTSRARFNSISIKLAGKWGFDEKPGEWSRISPETNPYYLQRLLCR